MITYRIKIQGDKFMLKARPVKCRRHDKHARRDIRRYRRIWWWDASRWNQRHGVKSEQWQEWEI